MHTNVPYCTMLNKAQVKSAVDLIKKKKKKSFFFKGFKNCKTMPFIL